MHWHEGLEYWKRKREEVPEAMDTVVCAQCARLEIVEASGGSVCESGGYFGFS